MFVRLVALLFIGLLVQPVSAQWSLSSHVASDGSVGGSPVVAGFSAGAITGQAGVRLGFSADAGYTPLYRLATPEQRRRPAQFTGDMDGLFFPVLPPKSVGVAPYVLVGMGVRSANASDEPETLTGSYGGGLQVHLARNFGIFAETRRRLAINESAPGHVVDPDGWEIRFGLSIRIGGTGARPTPQRRPVTEVVGRTVSLPAGESLELNSPPTSRTLVAAETIETAETFLGVPYVWGGDFPTSGFDCSGYVRYVYEKHGIYLPRVSRQQARAGVRIRPEGAAGSAASLIEALEPGDLMFFAGNGSRVDHVAIYTGNGRILHASKGRGEVAYDDLWSERGAWFRRHLVGARRVITTAVYP